MREKMREAVGQYGLHLARRSHWQKVWWLLRRAVYSGYRDNAFGIAKGAAYSGLLSFFPILTSVTAVLVQANASSVSQSLARLIFQVVPPGTEEIVRYNFTERGARPVSLLVFAGLLSLIAGSGLMMSLMEGFRAAYRIPCGRSFFRQRGVAMLLVFAAALPLIGASALIVFGERIEQIVLTRVGVLERGEEIKGWVSLFTNVGRTALAISAIVLGTSLLYHIGPNHDRYHPWRDKLPGALLATALWWLTTTVFGWYVRNIANYNVLYGSVGAVIALIVWMYLLAIIALIGCEYNAERQRLRETVHDICRV